MMKKASSYKKRNASKAGTWYSNDDEKLNRQINGWLENVDRNESIQGTRAIIGPHAGYAYSGQSAAYAYKYINPENINTVIVLGPMHCKYLKNKCYLSPASSCETPFGDIPINKGLNQELFDKGSGKFLWMNREIDEEEHSLEMHFPYIFKIMEGHDYNMVHVMIGDLSDKAQKEFGRIFADYLDDPNYFFIVSSDFCHWGKRFGFQHYDEEHDEIYQSIEALDKQGIEAIETQDPSEFSRYLKSTRNTICGRMAIGVLLHTIQVAETEFDLEFVYYTQSNKCKQFNKDSSVSYASGILSVKNNDNDNDNQEEEEENNNNN